jgi:hypothetical protein
MTDLAAPLRKVQNQLHELQDTIRKIQDQIALDKIEKEMQKPQAPVPNPRRRGPFIGSIQPTQPPRTSISYQERYARGSVTRQPPAYAAFRPSLLNQPGVGNSTWVSTTRAPSQGFANRPARFWHHEVPTQSRASECKIVTQVNLHLSARGNPIVAHPCRAESCHYTCPRSSLHDPKGWVMTDIPDA